MQRDSIDFSSSDVGKLFRRFLFPTVMGMVFSAVFVITDGIFVGRGIGSDALASVNIVAPLFTLGTGLGLMFGMGGSVVASINLAQGKRRVAEINITQSLVLPALLIALLSALLIHWHEPLLLLLGTPGELMVPAREYLVWFTLFLAPLAVFNILMFIVRLDGAPGFAMACNIMAACINIVLDYLFIFVFEWGLAGAAVATGIGYVVGSGVMLWYMFRRNRTLRFVKLKISGKSMRLTVRNLWYMSYIGFPALLSELAISCLMIVGNYTFIHYVGKDGVAAYSIACYIFPIIFMVYNGIIQSAQPIISYNFGAGQFDRVRQTIRRMIAITFTAAFVYVVFAMLRPALFAGLFTTDPELIVIVEKVLPVYIAGMAIFGLQSGVQSSFLGLGQAKISLFIALLRKVILLIPLALILPHFFGVMGVYYAEPIADVCSVITAVTLFLCNIRKILSTETLAKVTHTEE